MADLRAEIMLEINLTKSDVQRNEIEPEITRNFIGGKGTNARLFWDRMSPGTDAFAPESVLIFSTGLLTSTLAPGASFGGVTYKSPQSGLLTYSAFGGYWPAEFRRTGYDKLLITGRSDKPVYLWIDDGRLEIRTADHLWGLNTLDTISAIKQELKRQNVEILCIGPAGENKVYSASIESTIGASASRGGVGALLGNKNIKAIAVRGTKDITIGNPAQFQALCQETFGKFGPLIDRSLSNAAYSHGGTRRFMKEALYGNFAEYSPPEIDLSNIEDVHEEFMNTYEVRRAACFNCAAGCRHTYRMPDGSYLHVKCMSWSVFQVGSKVIDYNFALKCYDLCRKYGLDVVSTADQVSFAIAAYQKGLLTLKDTGIKLQWGNQECVLELIGMIARRQSIGNLLADGLYLAAKAIGNGAEDLAVMTKKLEQPPVDVTAPYMGFIQAINEKGDLTRHLTYPRSMAQKPMEEKQKYLNSEFFYYPERFKQYILDNKYWNGEDHEGICQIAAYDEDYFNLVDTSGMCFFLIGHYAYPPISPKLIAQLSSWFTGLDLSVDEAFKCGRRTANLIRAYNLTLGLSRADDSIDKRYFSKHFNPGDSFRPLNREKFEQMTDRYYEIKGWNNEGIPTDQTLNELGLDFVKVGLKQRGIS